MNKQAIVLLCVLFVCSFTLGYGQEHRGSLQCNRALASTEVAPKTALKTTSTTLPFFDDFTIYDVHPDKRLWVDNQVYINNTMCVNPPSRGVATFDALNSFGQPWYPYSNTVFNRADSLTSQPIDLSSYSANDSIYLSFYYQPEGYGYRPLVGDSLMLLMRIRSGDWKLMWRMAGSRVQPFTQVLIPVTDTLFFHSSFQFRFVNIAALNYADAIWNLDYVRMDANRRFDDTAITDVAFTKDPTYLLNDYTYMPYRQFFANATAERATTIVDSVRNNSGSSQLITHSFTASDLASSTVLQSPALNTALIVPYATVGVVNSTYSTTVPPSGAYDKVTFVHKHYLETTTGTGPTANDTVVKQQVFDNYLAYDDGSPEQSYYLTLFPTLPGKIAIEHHLNVPDTLRGMAIYFGRTAPPAIFKTFDIYIWSALQGVSGAAADNVLHRQPACDPGYADVINDFWIYKFDTPVVLPAGTFYAGVQMPAESGSDSLYFGLDVNRIGGNHAYYNVLAAWQPSLIQGAIMMRPLLGQPITASSVPTRQTAEPLTVTLAPNPSDKGVKLLFASDRIARYNIINSVGSSVATGTAYSGDYIDITLLEPGVYFVKVTLTGSDQVILKMIKN